MSDIDGAWTIDMDTLHGTRKGTLNLKTDGTIAHHCIRLADRRKNDCPIRGR